MNKNKVKRNSHVDQKFAEIKLASFSVVGKLPFLKADIPLDKSPQIRPVGVREVLRRIIGKTISTQKEEIKLASGPLQVCAGHSEDAEATMHAQIFDDGGTDEILLIDARNIQITCPEMSMYIINMYRSPSRLFTCGGEEILSQEGTTQGDPLAMPWYEINTSILIHSLRAHNL